MSAITLSPAYVARPAVSTVRLTRRGRLVVFLLALGVALVAALLLSGRSTATSETGRNVPTEKVTVEPGQTLWGIAAEVADDGDVRAMVDEIEQLNALDDPMVYAGQVLFVPAG